MTLRLPLIKGRYMTVVSAYAPTLVSDELTKDSFYSVFQKSDAKIEITITATNLIRIKYPLSSFNYHLSGANIANFNKIYCTVLEQQLFKNWNKNRSFQYGKVALAVRTQHHQ